MAFSVAINRNHIIEDQNECIYFLDIYACWSSTLWFPFMATEKNTKALSVAIKVWISQIRWSNRAKNMRIHYSWHYMKIQYFYRTTPNNKILMLHARCIYCYLLCCSPATKINKAPPSKRNKRLIVKAVHDRSTWWWFMTWHITTKALSVKRIIQQNTDKKQRQREEKKHIKRHSGQGLTNNDYVHKTSCNQEKQTSRQIHRL